MRIVLAILLTTFCGLAGASQYVTASIVEVSFKSWVKHPVVLVTTTLQATRDLKQMSSISVAYADTAITVSPEILKKIENPILGIAHLMFCGRAGIIVEEYGKENEGPLTSAEHPCLALTVSIADERHKDEINPAYYSFYFVDGELWKVDKSYSNGDDWVDIEVWGEDA